MASRVSETREAALAHLGEQNRVLLDTLRPFRQVGIAVSQLRHPSASTLLVAPNATTASLLSEADLWPLPVYSASRATTWRTTASRRRGQRTESSAPALSATGCRPRRAT